MPTALLVKHGMAIPQTRNLNCQKLQTPSSVANIPRRPTHFDFLFGSYPHKEDKEAVPDLKPCNVTKGRQQTKNRGEAQGPTL